jgi:hypothetical protein
MKRPFPLYHWSPTERRKSILREGLKTHKLSRCGQWRPPYICFSDSPSWAWGASGDLGKNKGEQWDLWMVWTDKLDAYEELSIGSSSGKPTEFRVYHHIPKSKIWYVGSRMASRPAMIG